MPVAPVGIGPAGNSPLGPGSTQGAFSAPTSPHYDPATKDAVVLANGRVQGVHWVDAWMSMALSIPLGTIKSAPYVGHRFRQIEYSSSNLERTVQDYAKQAVAPRVKGGDVKIQSVQVARVKSGFVVVVTYINLRTAKPGSVATSLG